MTIKKSLIKCNWTIRKRLTRCKMRLKKIFFFNDTATTEIYTLSLHDALPILRRMKSSLTTPGPCLWAIVLPCPERVRSEEHTSELQSRPHLVCRLLLEKKNGPDHRAAEMVDTRIDSHIQLRTM